MEDKPQTKAEKNLQIMKNFFTDNEGKSGFQKLESGELRIVSSNLEVIRKLGKELENQGFKIISESDKNTPVAKWGKYYSIAVKHDNEKIQGNLEGILDALQKQGTLRQINEGAPTVLQNQTKPQSIRKRLASGEKVTDEERQRWLNELAAQALSSEGAKEAQPVYLASQMNLDNEPSLPAFEPVKFAPKPKQKSYLSTILTAAVLAITTLGGGMMGLRQLAASKEAEKPAVVQKDDLLLEIHDKLQSAYKEKYGAYAREEQVEMAAKKVYQNITKQKVTGDRIPQEMLQVCIEVSEAMKARANYKDTFASHSR